jgi:4-hydroxy-tetrahydrodipicolinate reductase
MNIVLLGHGKTGALVADVARERGHDVHVLKAQENANAQALYAGAATEADVVIDFTTPEAVLKNIEACARAGKNMVVGTTGWYGEMSHVKELVERAGTGFVWGANFSIGVNIFFEVARSAAAALKFGYTGQIMERHHMHKKDAPSGTAVALQRVVEETGGKKLEISSIREGETVGMHVMLLDSPHDSILLTHDSKSRRGFAEGTVRAAEWVSVQKGFYDFKDIWRQLA